jgi:hypothetical protein
LPTSRALRRTVGGLVFQSYSDHWESISLDEIVAYLERSQADSQNPVFHAFPIRDWVHLVKNLRQRVRNHTVLLMPDCPVVDAFTFADLVPRPVLSVPGQGGAMSDRLAVEVFSSEVLAAAFECGNYTAPLVIGPWTFIAAAIDSATLTEAARLEALSAVFAGLGRI